MPRGHYKRHTPSEDRDMADMQRVRRIAKRRNLIRANRRQADQERARELKAECDELLAKPLRRPLEPKQKAEIRERVQQGLRPLRGSNVWSGV